MIEEEQAKIIVHWWEFDAPPDSEPALILRIADAIRDAVAEEREACAQVVQGFRTGGTSPLTVAHWGEVLAAAIRNRK